MNATINRIEDRNKSYQRSLDAEEVKKRRDDNIVELRKKKRIDNLVKRSRNTLDSTDLINFDPSQINEILVKAEPRLTLINISSTERMSILINLISLTNDESTLNPALELLRKLASSENPHPLSIIIQSGITRKIIGLLNHEDSNIKFNTTWILTNLCTQSTETCMRLAEEGVIEGLAKLATSEVLTEYSHQALWALSNLAGDNYELRNRVFSTGISDSIFRKISISQNIELGTLGTMIWLLSNLLKFRPLPQGNIVKEFLSLLPKLLPLPYEDILVDTLRALGFITYSGENLTLVFSTMLVGRIVTFLEHDSYKIKLSALIVISNLSTGDATYMQALLDFNLINYLFQTLCIDKRNLIKESLFVLNNIVTGPWTHAQKIITHKDFNHIISCLEHMDKEIRTEALYFITLLVKTHNYEFKPEELYLIEKLLNLIEYGDPEAILTVLEILERIFEIAKKNQCDDVLKKFDELGGIERLERLQSHPNGTIYQKAYGIMCNYIGGEISQNYIPSGTFQ